MSRAFSRSICLAINACFLVLVSPSPATAQGQTPLGIFEGNGDVGAVLHPGSSTYESSKSSYTVAGNGENTWFTSDAFHFV